MLDNCGTSTAQRAWLIDEVVRNILAHVPSVGCSNTLANCARVCTALSEPALDILWSRMTRLSPLCELLDESTVDKNAGAVSATISHNSINEDDWSRFTRYARRVRKLHYHCREGPSERLSQRTFAALVRRASRAGAPLLPRLEELSWLQCSPDITPYRHFLSPSLRRVTVYVQVGSDSAPASSPSDGVPQQNTGFLRLLDAQSPQVEELSLEGIELPASLEPLLAFKWLRVLQLGAVMSPVAVILSYCGAMPNLSSLSVDLSRSPAASPAATPAHSPLDTPALRALEVLRVAGAPSLIEELLLDVRAESLRSASLSIGVPEYDQEGGARCTGLLSSRFATSLQTVRVRFKRSADRLLPAAPRRFGQYVRPLLPIRGLRECTVAVEDPAPVTMTDGDVREVAEAWPALASLEVALRPSPSAGGTARMMPCVGSLAVFARCCPALSSLRIPVGHDDISALDGRGHLTPHDGDVEAGAGHAVRELWLSGVWFSEQESNLVVPFLRRTFPRADLGPMVGAGVLRGRAVPVLDPCTA